MYLIDILALQNLDYLLMYGIQKMTENHQDLLFHKLCVAKKINILTSGPTRFPSRTIISTQVDKIDKSFLEYEAPDPKNKTINELQNFMLGYNKNIKSKIVESMLSLDKIILLSIKYLTTISRKNFKLNFENRGKTPLKVIWHVGLRIIKQKGIQRYLSKISINQLNESQFIYFPLHFEPERSLLIGSTFYENQIDALVNVAKSIPINYKLFVKEHPKMEKIGMRDISTYKKINRLPNVELVDQSIPNEEILKKCSLVISIGGTSGLEAAFFKKPCIVFSDIIFSELSFVYRIKNIEDLPMTIRESLKKEVSIEELNRYVNFINDNSFAFNFSNFTQIALNSWYADIIEDITITEEQIKAYLKKYDSEFEKLTKEFKEKMRQ